MGVVLTTLRLEMLGSNSMFMKIDFAHDEDIL